MVYEAVFRSPKYLAKILMRLVDRSKVAGTSPLAFESPMMWYVLHISAAPRSFYWFLSKLYHAKESELQPCFIRRCPIIFSMILATSRPSLFSLERSPHLYITNAIAKPTDSRYNSVVFPKANAKPYLHPNPLLRPIPQHLSHLLFHHPFLNISNNLEALPPRFCNHFL